MKLILPATSETTTLRETSSEATTWATWESWETTSDEYDDENREYDDTTDDTDETFDILDPEDYEVVGENCQTINGRRDCIPIYRYI